MRLWLDFCQLHIAKKIPSHLNSPSLYKRPPGAHHQQRQPDLAPLRIRADAIPPLPVPRPRRRLDRAEGPPQEDLGSGASNTERRGNSGVENALQDGEERREGEMMKWWKGSVRFRLIPIDSTHRGNMVRTEEMSCSPGDRGVLRENVLQFIMNFFIRTYFRTVYFIITYLLCLFSILFGSSVISTDI